jgi:hypothetical protein
MKKYIALFVTVMALSLSAYAGEQNCTTVTGEEQVEDKLEIKTDVPKHLEGATIIVRTKDGRETSVPAEKFKVVPRKQQYIVTKVSKKEKMTCSAADTRNLVMLGVRKDHTGLTKETDGSTATVYSNKGAVIDAAYMRRKMFDTNFGAGVGLDTNATPKAFLGYEF